MKNLTTPQAILCGFGLVALAIASVPFSSQIVKRRQKWLQLSSLDSQHPIDS